MEAEFSALYWQYYAARLHKIVTVLNVASALAGASALTLLITDFPALTKIVALIAAGLTLFASYSGLQSAFEKAKIRADFFSKLSSQYEKLWNRINQALDEESISAALDILLDQEALVPIVPDQEYDDRLRERVYNMLIDSKGLPTPITT